MKPFKIFALLMFASITGIHAQEKNPFGNPIIPDMTADASIILVDDTFAK